AAKARKHVVGDHRVPSLPVQCRGHGGGGLDPLVCRFIASVLQFQQQQRRVAVGILDQEYSQGTPHFCKSFPGGAISSICSQYKPNSRTISTNSSKSTGLRM